MHLSDEDESELVTYYRTFGSLQDSFAMDGNCLHSDPTRACAYPCFDEAVTYGVAVRGFQRMSRRNIQRAAAPLSRLRLPVSIDVDISAEPDGRAGGKPVAIHANVTVHELVAGRTYTLYRYGGFNSFPASGTAGFESKLLFKATGAVWRYRDPRPFMSSGAVYYIATPDSDSVQPPRAQGLDG